jgi:hypothetical protein
VLITTGGGLRDVALDTAPLASGRTYEVYAVLDDGYSDDPSANAREVVVLPNVLVDHGTRGSAPTVRLIAPNGGQPLPASVEIAWTASDPDPGDVVTIDLELLEIAVGGSATAVATIAGGLPNSPSTFAWNTSGVPATRGGLPIQYKVRVVARDAGNKNVRVDDSDAPFTIATTTTLTWADVRPVFLQTCANAGCHGATAQLPTPVTFRLDKYDAADPVTPIDGKPGVYEMRSRVYERMVVFKTMPPAYAARQPTADEIAMIADWINGGAPKGSGSQNAPPTFSWAVPNDSSITTTSTGIVTLSWSASDPEGALQGGSVSYAQIPPAPDQLATCDASITGWTEIPSVTVTAGTYDFVAPSTGLFCFRGQVTDGANQSTTSIAVKPVKYSTTPGP